MSSVPDRQEQIRLVHGEFIRRVVQALSSPEARGELESLIAPAEQQGWSALVGAVRRIAAGDRGPEICAGLDEEDQVIAEAILRGLQDPATLPDPQAGADATLAAPGLAHMIHAAATGNHQALALIGNMAEQMSKVGGPMARLAAIIRPLINGERDAERLCRGMDAQTRQLALNIIDELGRLQVN